MVLERIFGPVRDFMSQGLWQRAAGLMGVALVAIALSGLILNWSGWINLVGPGGVYLLALVIFAVMYAFVDPEEEYTKEDIMTGFLVAAFFPVAIGIIVKGFGSAAVQFGFPVIAQLQETVGQAVAQGVAESGAKWLYDWVGQAMLAMGMLFGGMSLTLLGRRIRG